MKRALGYFTAVNEEAIIVFNPDYMRIYAEDSGHISALNMVANKDAFLRYDCVNERVVKVNIDNILSSLGRIMEDDLLFFTLGDNSNVLMVNIMKRESTRSSVKRNREFCFPLIQLNSGENAKDFKIDYINKMSITSLLIKTAIGDMGVVVEGMRGSIIITFNKDKVRFQSGEKGEARGKVEYHKSELRSINVEGEKILKLNLKYLYDFFKPLTDDILLEFSFDEKKPLKCNFDVLDVKLSSLSTTSPFKFLFMIAPYVDFEEDTKPVEDVGLVEDEGLAVGEEFKVNG
jgi:hypothetical protein